MKADQNTDSSGKQEPASEAEARLERIESKLEDIGQTLEVAGRRGDLSYGMGIGLAGLSGALTLAVASGVWSRGEADVGGVAFLLTAVSLAIVYLSLLRFEGDYRRIMAKAGVGIMIVAPIGYLVSATWLSISWLEIGSLAAFPVGLALLTLSRNRRKEREVVEK